jgi:predicted adenylyl cyclase CyaB
MDDIEGLGAFIELEKIAEENDVAKIQDEMSIFLKKLGVSSEDRIRKGYDILMLESK